MQVFKACLKILAKNMTSMIIYLCVFLGFVILMTIWNPQADTADFSVSRPRMAITNNDEGNPISDGLVEYLGEYGRLVEIEPEQFQDALFFRQVVYILQIPSGFSEDMLAGNDPEKLIRTTLPDSYQGTYSDQIIDRYLNAVNRYILADPNMPPEQIIDNVKEDLAMSSNVTVNTGEVTENFSLLSFYFTFLAYSLIAIMILAVTSLMLAFQQKDIRKRNLSSPVNLFSFNLQLLLGNFVFALISWIVFSLVSLYFYNQISSIHQWLLLIINTLVFIIAAMSMSFLVSQFVKNRNTQQAVANVLALGTCFISGVFVPQELLGEKVLAVASFTPTYWYVRAVRIANIHTDINLLEFNNFTQALLIQIAFAAAFIMVAMVVSRQRRQST